MRVLIVEDHRLTRQMLADSASEIGCETVVASGAYEALRIAEAERPDVILVDGLLPQMHGFELARLLRNLDPEYRPRIILMTAIYKNIRYQNEAKLKYGVDDYIIKPISMDTLRAVLS
ncbi:MAG TPA: response regulator [Thermoanaerobaculia bacterium]|nr:response regulator [Thermoanaerobaculia bacterium]